MHLEARLGPVSLHVFLVKLVGALAAWAVHTARRSMLAPQLLIVKSPKLPGPLDTARDCSAHSVALVEVTWKHCEVVQAAWPGLPKCEFRVKISSFLSI